MKKAGKILSAALAVLVTISGLFVNAFAAESKTKNSEAAKNTLWADGNPNVESADQNALDVIKWFSENDKGKNMTDLVSPSKHYYLLMPTTADFNNLTLWHSFSSNPKIDGVEIQNGKSTKAIHGTGDYTMTVNSDNYKLTVMQSQFIGSMYIATESGNMNYIHSNKENKESGNILVVEADGKQDYNGELAHIKGRGNTTWTNREKKPYNIKLDKKASLLGMDTSKKWCLLANAQEHTQLRNKIAYDLADEVGLDFSPNSEYVDLYLNGDYAGIYQLSEKVEEGKNNLVKINDLTDQTEKVNEEDLDSYKHHSSSSRGGMKYYDIPNNPDDITGGYLLEWEDHSKYDSEPSGFVTNRGQYVVIKGPEYASKEQVQYISSFVQDMEDAIYSSDGKNSKGKHYTEYLDADSAALMYLIEEFSVDIDAGITSCFFYKDSDTNGDGKIHAAPVWDFDVAFGNLENTKDGVSMSNPEKWFVSKSYQYENGQPTIFAQLFTHSDFVENVKKQYNGKFKAALEIVSSNDKVVGSHVKSIPAYREIIQSSVNMNFVRWDIQQDVLVNAEGSTYDSQINYLSNFITKRAAFFANNINNLKAQNSNSNDFVIYFKNSLNWDKVYVHYWNGNGNTNWPGVPMTEVDDGIYKFDFGAIGQKNNGKVQIVINNGYGNGQQTGDLSPSDGILYTPESTAYKTAKDAEATKSYYNCKESLYSQSKPDKPITDDKLLGDVDGDNKINSLDSLLILRASVKLETFDEVTTLLADVDGDGKITSTDALEVLRFSVNLPSDYNIGKPLAA